MKAETQTIQFTETQLSALLHILNYIEDHKYPNSKGNVIIGDGKIKTDTILTIHEKVEKAFTKATQKYRAKQTEEILKGLIKTLNPKLSDNGKVGQYTTSDLGEHLLKALNHIKTLNNE